MQQPDSLTSVLGKALLWAAAWMLVSFAVAGGVDSWTRFWSRLEPQFIGIVIVVAVNVGVLLPRLYFSRRQGLYILSAVALVALLTLVFYTVPYFQPEGGGGPGAGAGAVLGANPTDGPGPPSLRGAAAHSRRVGMFTLRFIFPVLMALLGSTLVEVMRFANFQEKEKIRVEREQLATEVKFLKSQINPHFLFNSLNNIYTLALLKDDLAPESLLRLSDMLRYMIYEAEGDTVPLHRELRYIRDYVNLQQLKDSRGLNVSLQLDERRPDLAVAPLLLIPFVENAFKHGRIEDLAEGFIEIVLETGPGRIDFTVRNNYRPGNAAKDGVGGIGLENVRKRLQLLYPDRHAFSASGDGTVFTATLSIESV